MHLLISGDNYVAVQHGSHHRLAALQYLINHNHTKLIQNISFNKDGIALVPCSVNLVIDRDDLRQMETVGSKSSQFSVEDAYKWFDLPFNLIDQKSDATHQHSSNQIQRH